MFFKNNDILFRERPFASVVKRDYITTTCAGCFKHNIKLLKCSQCDRSYYCNRDCQKRDWKQHKIECKCIANEIKKTYASDISLLTLRIMCKLKEGSSADTDYIMTNQIGLKPRCFDDLMSNLYEEPSIIADGFDKAMIELSSMLQLINLDVTSFVTRDKAKIIYAKSVTNNFEIQDDTNVTIGFGCYLNGSSLDHSCWPNSAYSFANNQLILKAIKPINPGDKVCINYTDTLQLRDDRRRHLQEQYLFECKCEACSNDELDREMTQLYCEYGNCKGSVMRILGTDKYQCNECNVIVDEGVMSMKHTIFRAKLYQINNMMINREYEDSYEVARRELGYFNLDQQPMNSGGLVQLCMGEKAFESALFLGDFEAALEICRMKPNRDSWMHERLVRFLGTEYHPIAQRHLEKFHKILGIL